VRHYVNVSQAGVEKALSSNETIGQRNPSKGCRQTQATDRSRQGETLFKANPPRLFNRQRVEAAPQQQRNQQRLGMQNVPCTE